MKQLNYLFYILLLLSNGCTPSADSKSIRQESTHQKSSVVKINTTDLKTAQHIIRKLYLYLETDTIIQDVTPVITDEYDSLIIGLNLSKIDTIAIELGETNLFSEKFIDNYKSIVRYFDKEIRNKTPKHTPWFVNELAPINFNSSANAWCLCQDNLEWNKIKVEHISNNKFQWKWGGLDYNTHDSWSKFRYEFELEEEDGVWKISYLQGFDLEKIK